MLPAMLDLLMLALSIGLPLLKLVLFPARTMSRGGSGKYLGAAMLVAMMMALWFGVRTLSDFTTDFAAGTAQAAASAPQPVLPDLDGLAQF